jgi:hypothetical protein
MYALKTPVAHKEDTAVDEAHPHTFRTASSPSREEMVAGSHEYF